MIWPERTDDYLGERIITFNLDQKENSNSKALNTNRL